MFKAMISGHQDFIVHQCLCNGEYVIPWMRMVHYRSDKDDRLSQCPYLLPDPIPPLPVHTSIGDYIHPAPEQVFEVLYQSHRFLLGTDSLPQ